MTTPTARAKELVQAVDAVVRDRSSDFRPRIGYFDDLEAVLATALTAAANEAAQAERERCAKVVEALRPANIDGLTDYGCGRDDVCAIAAEKIRALGEPR